MKLYKINASTLTALADIVRSNCGISDKMTPSTIAEKIYPIQDDSQFIFENYPSVFDYTSASARDLYQFSYITKVMGKWGCQLINIFNSCRYLNKVHLINNIELISQCFNSCNALSEVYLPNCKNITNCFNNCSNLSEVTLTQCETIMNAFNSVGSITNITLPNCSFISAAFMNCPLLSSARFYSTLEMSGLYNFQNCTSLNTLIFYDLKNITTGFCNGCENLTSLYLLGSTITNLNTTLIFTSASIPSIYVHPSYYNDYINATNWIQFSEHIISINTDASELDSVWQAYQSELSQLKG